MNTLIRILQFLAGFARPALATANTVSHDAWMAPAPPRHRARLPLHNENAGGPRSRIVSTPLVSRLLSAGSADLGIRPATSHSLPTQPGENPLRAFAAELLRIAGFGTPEEAWHTHRDELPTKRALVTDLPGTERIENAADSKSLLLHALVLGRCCGSLFSPERPIIWSERRLGRCVRLAEIDPLQFAREEDR
jgi:hypothetical protein